MLHGNVPVLGIDAGGTHLRGRLAIGAETVAEAEVPGGNIVTLGAAAMEARLAELLQRLGNPAVAQVCIGAAGSQSEGARETLQSILSRLLPGAGSMIVHDARLPLAALGRQSGIVIASGTGSSAYGRSSDGREALAGGWGYLLGDEGSGYGIVREAMRAMLRRDDLGAPPTLLTRSLLAALELTEARALPSFMRQTSPSAVAARAPVVFAAAEGGDEEARRIIDAAAESLLSLAKTVGGRIDVQTPLVLSGGVLLAQPLLRRGIMEMARKEFPGAEVLSASKPAVGGGVSLAYDALLASFRRW